MRLSTALSVFYVEYAFRRAATTPLRAILVLLGCSVAWIALFTAIEEFSALNKAREEAGTLGGAPGYRFAIREESQESARDNSSTFPAEYLTEIRQSVETFAIRLKGTLPVTDLKRESVASASIYFYQSPVSIQPDSKRSFPTCSFLSSALGSRLSETTVVVLPDWRCRVTKSPLPSTLISREGIGPSIIFPMDALLPLRGRDALGAVEVIWLGIHLPEDVARLLDTARSKYRLNVDVRRLSDVDRIAFSDLTYATKAWCFVAFLCLLIGTILYVGGMFHLIRKELAIRICFGTPYFRILRWLFLELFTQTAFLTSASAMFGMVYWSAVNGVHALYENFLLVIGVVGCVASLAFFITVLSASLVFRAKALIKLSIG